MQKVFLYNLLQVAPKKHEYKSHFHCKLYNLMHNCLVFLFLYLFPLLQHNSRNESVIPSLVSQTYHPLPTRKASFKIVCTETQRGTVVNFFNQTTL